MPPLGQTETHHKLLAQPEYSCMCQSAVKFMKLSLHVVYSSVVVLRDSYSTGTGAVDDRAIIAPATQTESGSDLVGTGSAPEEATTSGHMAKTTHTKTPDHRGEWNVNTCFLTTY